MFYKLKKQVCLNLFLIFTLSMSILGQDKPLKVFILAGQSNMVGKGISDELDKSFKGEQKNVLIFEDRKWVPLKPGQTFGPEISFAMRMSLKLKEPIGIIKCASGGTNLSKQWDPKDKGWNCYGIMRDTINAAKKSREINVIGMAWMQGESDAQYTEMAKSYGANLENLILTVRKEFDFPNMVFVAGRVNCTASFVDDVRKGQETCKAPHYAFVDCDKIEKGADKLHYSSKGLVELGEAFAESIFKLLAGKAKGQKK